MTTNDLQQAADFIRHNIAIDDEPGKLDHLRFADALTRHYRKKRRTRAILASTSAALSIAIVVALIRTQGAEELTYQVGESHQTGVVGSYVSAPSGKPLDIHFSEGSAVTLSPKSRGRVASTTAHGATVVLEDGRAHADIVHRKGTEWRVLAGPYVVGVTGTTFDVAFNVKTQTFELDMRSGSVKVTGPGLKSPIEIRDQQRLTLSIPSREPPSGTDVGSNAAAGEPLGLSGAQTAVPASNSTNCPANVAPTDAESKLPRDTQARAVPERAAVETESYQRLGERGQHERIVELAEQHGVDEITARVGRAELFALGNAARFVGKPQLASRAYRALRDRFGASNEAVSAAFFLGRLAESDNPAGAMAWYDRYVSEAPKGVWAADALGRRLVLQNQQQGREATLSSAREYLNRFPTGPYAGFARKLLAL
jgi:hypothetical protein